MNLPVIFAGLQNGIDVCALETAFCNGFPTGGFCPQNCRTLDGPRYDLKKKYGLIENTNFSYKSRTYLNVKNSDATVQIFSIRSSPGERCTRNAIKEYKKPHFEVNWLKPCKVKDLVDWLIPYNIINFAGNSEVTVPGIYDAVYPWLDEVFKMLKEIKNGT